MNKPDNVFYEFSYDFNAFENYIEFSCFTDQIITGMDMTGNYNDILAFNECIDCDIYDSIKNTENIKHAMNNEFLKHISVAKKVFSNNHEIHKDLGLYGIINFDLESWVEHVKLFYITILSNEIIFNALELAGIQLTEVENAIELLIQLEELAIDNRAELKNQYLN